ncbi:MAG: Maebl, partial [uncultured Nocardioides sp.]
AARLSDLGPDRRPHRRRQHLAQVRRGSARRDRPGRRPDDQTGVRRLVVDPPRRLVAQAQPARPPAHAPARPDHAEELHRLRDDHRRHGPALRRQRRGLRPRLERLRLREPGHAAARRREVRARYGRGQDPCRLRQRVRQVRPARDAGRGRGCHRSRRPGVGGGARGSVDHQPAERTDEGRQRPVRRRRLGPARGTGSAPAAYPPVIRHPDVRAREPQLTGEGAALPRHDGPGQRHPDPAQGQAVAAQGGQGCAAGGREEGGREEGGQGRGAGREGREGQRRRVEEDREDDRARHEDCEDREDREDDPTAGGRDRAVRGGAAARGDPDRHRHHPDPRRPEASGEGPGDGL